VSLAAEPESAGFAARAGWQAATKRRIGRAAADLIQPGQTVLLDAGTTTAELAGYLVDRVPLTVAVLSLQAADRLADQPGIRLLVIGGESRPGERSLVGHLTLRMLDELWFDCFLMSIGAVHHELGWSEFVMADATVKQHGMRRAERTVVVADSTKLGVRAFAKVADLNQVNTFVTDQEAAGETLTAIRGAGVELVQA
jgi:DeoR family transcriptional regulator of aga operon